MTALAVNGETCCYTSPFLKGSDLCGALVRLELTHLNITDLHPCIWGSGERDGTNADGGKTIIVLILFAARYRYRGTWQFPQRRCSGTESWLM